MRQIELSEAVAWLMCPKTTATIKNKAELLKFLGMEKGKFVYLNTATRSIYHAYKSEKNLIVSRRGYQTGEADIEKTVGKKRVGEWRQVRRHIPLDIVGIGAIRFPVVPIQ